MSKFKKSFGIAGLSVLSLTLLGGVGIYANSFHAPQAQITKADVSTSIENDLPEYFSAKFNDTNLNDSPLALVSGSDEIELKFLTNTDGLYNKNPENENEWQMFNFTNVTVKKDGQTVTPTEGTEGYAPSFIKNHTAYTGATAQTFDLKVKLGSEDKYSSDTLTLKDEGVYEITIQYILFQTEDNGNVFSSETPLSLTLTFMLFNHDTYLESGMSTPKVSSNIDDKKSFEQSGKSQINYFFNYNTDSLPYITYDVTKYNLKLTHVYNLSTNTYDFVYNFKDDVIENESDLKTKQDGNNLTIYFEDLGDYTLDFDLIYGFENGDDFNVYALPLDVNNQKLYMYGYQATYTKFNTSTKKNTYPEFKAFDEENNIVKAADVTKEVLSKTEDTIKDKIEAYINASGVTPATTNQAPVKFKEFASLKNNGAKLYKVSVSEEGSLTLDEETTIPTNKNISEPGRYVVVFDYNFENYRDASGYIAANTPFTQVFYFEITNETPSVDVCFGTRTGDSVTLGESLSSGDYTNKNVYVKNNYEASAFNSAVDITIQRYDFVNKIQAQDKKLNEFDSFEVEGKTYYEFTENGKYTIIIKYGRDGSNKIVRRFNIDNTEISDVNAVGVKLSGSNSTYVYDNEIDTFTNQPIIFSYQQTKDSGASVYAYYKYYPIEVNPLGEENLSDILEALTAYGFVPVEYKLNLQKTASWIFYQNARSVANTTIPSSYVKTAPGLYVLEVYDDAGNTTTKMFVLDNTSPNFVISQDGTYRFLKNNETLSKDANIFWGDYKLLGVNLPADASADFYKENKGTENSIKALYDDFKDTYYERRSETPLQPDYIKIAINEKALVKDPVSNYEFLTENGHDIVSSFKLCYTNNIDGSTSYYFTTTVENSYVEVDPASIFEGITTDSEKKKAATEARLTGSKVSIIGNIKYYPDSSTVEIDGGVKDYDNFDGKNYDLIYNIEGNYTFLIRDTSNTKESYDERTTYTTYPSGYKLLQLTSDASVMQIKYKDNSSTYQAITRTADYAAVEGSEVVSGFDDQKVKYAYYEPTSLNEQLYISIKPTVDQGEGKTTQVDKVLVSYYPFKNSTASYMNISGNLVFDFYKDFSSTPEYKDVEVYSFDLNGENTDENGISIALQTLNGVTADGMYKITRTYKLGGNYTMSEYDYYRRTLTLIVDRGNVITEPEVIEVKAKVRVKDLKRFTVLGKFIKFNEPLEYGYKIKAELVDGSFVEFNNSSSYTTIGEDNYYIAEKTIKDISLYQGSSFIAWDSTSEELQGRSTQSITGNGIFVSVFADTDSSKEYPSFKASSQNANVLLNAGYTFYTTKMSYNDYLNGKNVNSVFTTNKVPFKIYIPAYKYTEIVENAGDGFVSVENKNLSYFYENDIEKSSDEEDPIQIIYGSDCEIEAYKLFAEIYYKDLTTPIAISNGVDDNGFLTFDRDINFKNAGKYIVVVKQAKNDVPGEGSFLNAYSFAFNVEETSPDFDLYNNDGKALKADIESKYYTNSDKIVATWTDSQSDYMLNIDKKNILLKLNGETDAYKLVIENGIITSCKKGAKDIKDAFAFNSLNNVNTLTIDLSKIGLINNGNSLSITVSYDVPEEYKDHYESKEKIILIDRTVFDVLNNDAVRTYTSTVDDLFAKIENLDSENLTLDEIRVLTKSDGSLTDNKEEASYSSSSVITNFYRYYSYPVDRDFFDLLNEKTSYNRLNNPTGTTQIYVRKIKDIYNSEINFEETTYLNFSESSNMFTSLDEISNFETDYYYEVIETDYAGNILVYLVYLKKNNGNGLVYHTNSAITSQVNVKDNSIKSNLYNIYGKTDMYIDSISLQGDRWGFVELENAGITTKFVFSPYLDSNSVKNISTGEVVALNSILNKTSTMQKAKLYVTDRSTNTKYTVYVNRSNTSVLNIEKASSGQGIQIALPNGNISTENLIQVFPVEVKVAMKEVGSDTYTDVTDGTFVNNPNQNLQSEYNYQSAWNAVGNEVLNASYENGYLVIKFNNEVLENTKVKYTVIDNFGNEVSEIQIIGTDFTDSITHPDRYQSQDPNGDLYYRTQSTFEYKYNSLIYIAKIYQDDVDVTNAVSPYFEINTTNDPNYIKFNCNNIQLDEKFEIRVFDAEETSFVKENSLKTIFVHLYRLLPVIDGSINAVSFKDENGTTIDNFDGSGSITIDGRTYRFNAATTFANIVTVSYPTSTGQFAYSGYILKDGLSDSFEAIDKRYRIDESGIYYILFKYTDETVFTNEYVLYKLEILDSSKTFYYVTVDGNQVKAQSIYYTVESTGKQYSNYYIINIPYSERSRIEIVPNEYQKVRVLDTTETISSSNATTVIYTLTNKQIDGNYPIGVSPYTDNIAISYIAPTSKPAKEITYQSVTGELVNLADSTESSVMIAIEKESSNDSLKIRWNKSYGLTQNLINLTVLKDGFKYDLPVYEENSYFYTVLTISGTYRLTFKDNSGNIQTFANKEYIDITFLKDVHFTMTHKNLDGEEVETEAIDHGVFNGDVRLNVKNISTYYSQSAVGTGAGIIKVLRNGEESTDYTYDVSTASFLFTKVGFYQVTFSATTTNGIEVREQTYAFSIINPNESRYAFEFSPFSTYIIEKTIKDNGINVEEKDDLNLDSVYVSYDIDGNAKWTVTIDTKQKLTPGSDETTKFEFSFLIRSATPPISISIPEGSTTTKAITISFNCENIYNSVGDCVVSVGSQTFEIDATSTGVETITITAAGTYFVQVKTISGNLLYSYKIVKKDPLNGWAITAIVIGSIVLVAGIIIVIKLRKRIKVK